MGWQAIAGMEEFIKMLTFKVIVAASVSAALGALFVVAELFTGGAVQGVSASELGYGYGYGYGYIKSAHTEIQFANNTVAPCFSGTPPCFGQVVPAGSIVHDKATLTSSDATLDPTGFVVFGFYDGNAHCSLDRATSHETVTVGGSGGVTTAESSNTAPLAAGDYSYKAVYFPDPAAQARGFRRTPAECESLLAVGVGVDGEGVDTVIHFADHSEVPCFATACVGRVAPAGSVVHDEATVTSSSNDLTPTGTIRFAFYEGELNCSLDRATSHEEVALSGTGGVATAETSNTVPLTPGDYSYRAIYVPDSAAVDHGFRSTPSACEPLEVSAAKSS